MKIAKDSLKVVAGGLTQPEWDEVRAQAKGTCPNTVAANPHPPANRKGAQRMADACAKEGNLGFLGKSFLQGEIDKYFPPK